MMKIMKMRAIMMVVVLMMVMVVLIMVVVVIIVVMIQYLEQTLGSLSRSHDDRCHQT